jgi:hypothetical protein
MRTKRTSNAERRTPNIERRHDGLNFIFDVGSSEFDVRCFRPSRHVSPVTCHPQRGVALVITLILLSVVTFMAITFLALSRRERSAVTTVTDTASARLAADAALANAEAQVMANVLATTNPYNFTLLVSTNYINRAGFQIGSSSFTNVNYQYPNGNPLNAADFLQNLINLYYSPRAPVFIPTNSAGANDFRFYLDLNRNGRFDGNGLVINVVDNAGNSNGVISEVGDPEWIGVLERPDAPYGPNNKFIARYAFIAVPVGNTLDLNAIHNQAHWPSRSSGPLPADLRVNPSQTGPEDNFIRNEGVGSWEINLGAFLTDLNTNEWDNSISGTYQYPPLGFGAPVAAFDDARALLAYRYANNFKSLASVKVLYGAFNANIFCSDGIDGYTYGQPLMTTFQLPTDSDLALNGVPNPPFGGSPWVGADNTNHFFTHQELFDSTKTEINVTPPGFVEHLKQAGTNVSTYDRYTFYRLLSQLGTDSAPDSGKMNLNYDNLDPGFNGFLNTNGIAASTNFVAWQPLAFFTNAADRLLRAYTTQWRNSNPTNFATAFYATTNFNFINADQWTNYPAFGVGNIPVLVSNRFVYSSAVNRVLQLAANMYDATINRYYDNSLPLTPLPTVFRPFFNKVVTPTATNVYICGFSEVTNINQPDLPLSVPYNLANPDDLAKLVATNYINVFGVPMIIGAKKGFPNFNEFYMESAFQLTRKLMVTRQSTNVPSPAPDPTSSFWGYYEMFNLSLTNQFGVECWNSYRSNYTRPTDIYVNDYLTMTLTNDENNFSYPTNLVASGFLQFTPPNYWSGTYNSLSPNPQSFQTNFGTMPTNFAAVAVSRYRFNGGNPYLSTNLNLWYETGPTGFGQYPQPHWGLTMINNLQVIMVDHATGRLIDYVQLSGPNSIRDLTAEILNGWDTVVQDKIDTGYNSQWDTNLINGIPNGFASQYTVSQGNGSPTPYVAKYWGQDQQSAYDQMNAFLAFTMGSGAFTLTYPGYVPHPDQIAAAKMTNAMQMAYTPTATVVQDIVWQANDPLVHYMASDLNNPTAGNGLQIYLNWPGNLGKLNQRYMPWGGNPSTGVGTNMLAIKDPLVSCSDNWDFPTNKFPTVGWLGRVHRGTPWQTVYLKASDVLSYPNNFGVYGNNGPKLWVNWTGNVNPFEATNTAPKKDRLLFDLFTTAFNDNATRGTLSVNVGPTNANLAAWSALFSGIIVPTNLVGGYTVINPAGPAGAPVPVGPPPSPNSPLCLGYLVQNGTNGINDIRANTNLFPLQSFTHVGDILAVPALTERSPFLAGLDPNTQISDELMEWLPQQTMSLLRASSSPRYVIYCYGQALKPAPNSIYTGGGQFFGIVTNYQVVSEIATRAVVRFGSSVTNVIVPVFTGGFFTGNFVSQPVVTNNNAVIESFNILPPD